ncbi:MAG: hypothetical protein K8R46_14350 [Pirellulales bacterium]|nr:hypothetical protein [Pirellulales bacterium]
MMGTRLLLSLVLAGAAAVGGLPDANAATQEDNRWAVLIQHARGLKDPLVKQYGWLEDHIYVLDPNKEKIEKALQELGGKLTEKDILLLSSCGHAKLGCFIGTDVQYPEIERHLKKINAFKFVFQSTCHSAAAIRGLPSADIVYAACKEKEKEGGIFFGQFLGAISNPELSDKDGDGRVSLGEAFDHASRNEPIQKGYAELMKRNPKFWPHPTGPLPVRKERTTEYRVWFGNDWSIDKKPVEK